RRINGQPLVDGWNFSLLAEVSTDTSRWTAPMDVRLRAVGEDANRVAAGQIRALLSRLSPQPGLSPPGLVIPDDPDGQTGAGLACRAPLFVLDAGYNPAVLT